MDLSRVFQGASAAFVIGLGEVVFGSAEAAEGEGEEKSFEVHASRHISK